MASPAVLEGTLTGADPEEGGSMTTTFQFDVHLARDARSPAAARHVFDGLAGDIPFDVLERFRIVASELVTNAVTRGPGVRERVRMLASIERDRVRLGVPAWDPSIGAGDGTPDRGELSRSGLFLVDRMADRWGVDDSPEPMVWCEFDLEFDAAPGHEFTPRRTA
jgi:anti-sigma regulatory factor (Ser/Thr protein kinase)